LGFGLWAVEWSEASDLQPEAEYRGFI
jgi:hypothetical protein